MVEAQNGVPHKNFIHVFIFPISTVSRSKMFLPDTIKTENTYPNIVEIISNLFVCSFCSFFSAFVSSKNTPAKATIPYMLLENSNSE